MTIAGGGEGEQGGVLPKEASCYVTHFKEIELHPKERRSYRKILI